MSISIQAVRLILFILFGSYEFWAFKNRRSLYVKLFPIVLAFILGLSIILLSPFLGSMGFLIIFVILIVELSVIASMSVVFLEMCFALFNPDRSIKRVVILAMVFALLLVVYFLGQRMF